MEKKTIINILLMILISCLLISAAIYIDAYLTSSDIKQDNFGITFPEPPILMRGYDFNELIPDETTAIEFTTGAAGVDAFDVSEAQDGSVMAWFEGSTMYVSAVNGGKIIANDTSRMFENKTNLLSVNFKNLELTSIGEGAFVNCSSLTSIVIPERVETIGGGAFAYCNSLTSIEIPESVTKIDYNLFRGCTNLTSIVLPNGITEIGSYAFRDCSSLPSIDIPEGVKIIGNEAFYNCSSLISIVIPNGITEISRYTFAHCSSLTSIDIPEGVKIIGNNAFYNCISLSSVDLPASVERIETAAFNVCSSLTSIDIPDSVTFIGTRAFNKCSSLTSIRISKGVETIYNNTFSDCTNLTTVFFAEDSQLKEIGDQAFYQCSSLISIDLPDTVISMGDGVFYNCTNLTSIDIPDSVISIGKSFLTGCGNLTSIIIPKGVETIGNSAFSRCYNLTTITFEEGSQLKTIGNVAFSDCSNLTSIDIPECVESIGEKAFYNCANLKTMYVDMYQEEWENNVILGDSWSDSVHPDFEIIFKEREPVMLVNGSTFNSFIPNTATRIEFLAMPQTYGLTDRTVPANAIDVSKAQDGSIMAWMEDTTFYVVAMDGGVICANPNSDNMFSDKSNLTYIVTDNLDTSTIVSGMHMFSNCVNLTNNVNDFDFSNVRNLLGAFYGCTWLTEFTIPENVTIIEHETFAKCSNLKSVTIHNGVEVIDMYAFFTCPNLVSITIPNSVTTINRSAFAGCSNLTTVIFEEGSQLKTIGDSAFDGCTKISSINLPTSVETISRRAFYGCTNLTSVVIPDGVKTIGNNAFEQCTSLETIDIPASLTEIGSSAFYWCNNLTAINVDPANEYYTSVDGVLFTKDMKMLIQYPSTKTDVSYTVPTGVEIINNYSFFNNNNLTTVIITEGVVEIGDRAFSQCTSLTSIKIPASVEIIGEYAFYYCSKLRNFIIPENSQLKSIGNYVFAASQFSFIELPSSVSFIGNNAFNNCNKLTTIYFRGTEDQWNTIEKGTDWKKDDTNIVFNYDAKRSNILVDGFTFNNAVPSSAKFIVFTSYSLVNSTVPADAIDLSLDQNGTIMAWVEGTTFYVVAMDDGIIYANQNCNNMFSYKFNLTYIDTSNLNTVYVTSWQYTFYNCTKLTNNIDDFNFYNSRLMAQTFNSCTWITEFKIPKNTTIIGAQTFYNCSSLTSIVIPKNVTLIGGAAFSNCPNLQTVYFEGTEEEWNAISKSTDWNANVHADFEIIFNYVSEN